MEILFQTEDYLDPLLIVEYHMKAALKTTYQAWVDLSIFQQWFCPTGFTVAQAELDPKAGGYFKIHGIDNREDNQPTIAEIRFETAGNNTLLKLYSSFATEQQKETALNSDVVDGWRMFFKQP
jgi:hypothetical protein